VAIACEVAATDARRARELAAIVETCGVDAGQRVAVSTRCLRTPHRKKALRRPAVITLHLPVTMAATQHPAWCLACRVACFCPQTRVSVVVHGEKAFAALPASLSQEVPA
jgi:hypothetical protein